MTDIEIAKKTKLEKIDEIAKSLNISEEDIELYGKYKAKISNDVYLKLKDKKDGKLILVSSINPTPLGEGKTTVSIGLADGLRKIGKKSILALREPSLGPVFGLKGGATGGGYAQVAPMEEINLHFTGDLHAITAANNLLSAMIDNHIYFGNNLQIEKVTWKRCVDLNDRQLRRVETGLSGEKNTVPREDGFDITVASEIMAILCLAKDLKDLKKRLGSIIIGYNKEGNPVTAHDLNAEGSMTVLLKDAIKPNLVQTLEHTPAIIHGGPFANIAHGCNSVIATNLALKLADYCITEAGFGADLGAEKFLDIKRRVLQKTPDCVVLVATIKALKYHGGVKKEDVEKENIEALKIGFENLKHHIVVMKNVYNVIPVVAINRYTFDTDKEIETLQNLLNKENVEMSLAEEWAKGGEGTKDLSSKVAKICDKSESKFEPKYSYELEDSIEEKLNKVAKKVYGAEGIELSKEAKEQLKKIEDLGYSSIPVCIAKTQYSLSDDDKNLLCNEPYKIHIRELILKTGAGFIVAIAGKIMTMPGLPKIPAAERIDVDENGEIVGIF